MDIPSPEVQTQPDGEPPAEAAKQAPEVRAPAPARGPSIIVGVVVVVIAA